GVEREIGEATAEAGLERPGLEQARGGGADHDGIETVGADDRRILEALVVVHDHVAGEKGIREVTIRVHGNDEEVETGQKSDECPERDPEVPAPAHGPSAIRLRTGSK